MSKKVKEVELEVSAPTTTAVTIEKVEGYYRAVELTIQDGKVISQKPHSEAVLAVAKQTATQLLIKKFQ